MKAALHSQLLYQGRVRDRMRLPQGSVVRSDVPPSFFAAQHAVLGKISLANFCARSNLAPGRIRPKSQEWSAKMAWKAPKIVEVPCGMEINMYVSATRK
ncbi:coenzyme PQQ precursor peptide PqqA [Bradyrhizobium sp. S3.2.6]